MTDQLLIENLAIETTIGVYERERHTRQTVILDLCIDMDLAPAGRSDVLEDALDYAALVQALQSEVGKSSYQLLEALAEAIANQVLGSDPRVTAVNLTLHKPGAQKHADISVRISRTR